MKVMVIYAHPYSGSYNNAILKKTISGLEKSGHEIDLLDLNKDGFNPIMTEQDLYAASQQSPIDPKVLEYQERLMNANHVVFIFPIWYASMPAILKGFMDKVLSSGWAYEYVRGNPIAVGKLTHLTATVITTMGAPEFAYNLIYNNPLKGEFIKGTLGFVGIKKVKWIKIDSVISIDVAKRKMWLEKIETYMKKLK